MMVIGELTPPRPTVLVPPWDQYEDPTANFLSPYSPTGNNPEYYSALQPYLPSNEFNCESDSALSDELELPFDSFACDNFRMFEFKVRKCARGRSHDWTECPFAHPGEKARRRDPRRYLYSGASCPEFRKGSCKKGDSCEYAHGVFESWLHPARYRTQPCKDGSHCKRRVCFFAHSPEQLRLLPSTESVESAEVANGIDSSASKGGSVGLSPTSILVCPTISPPSDSPPMSPSGGGSSYGCHSVSELVGVMRSLQIAKTNSSPRSSWAFQMGSRYGSPRSPATVRPGFCSMPSTPTRATNRCRARYFDSWETTCQEEPEMERVESGRDIRAKMYAKLRKENSLDRDSAAPSPDVGWVSELVK